MPNEYHISRLINSYLKGTLSDAETNELNHWISESEDHRRLLEELETATHLKTELAYFSQADRAAVWAKVQDKLAETPSTSPNTFTWRHYVAIAATIAVILVGVRLFYFEGRDNGDNIKPGKNTATLTLGNGKTIPLSTTKSGVIIDASKLTYNDGSLVATGSQLFANADGSGIMTVSTPKGGTYQVILGDGTRVWLNADSRLDFGANFNANTRRSVKLTGEAYFEVAKNKARPFIVTSLGQRVQVLGTHFNISAYKEDPEIKTTLLEGSVRVDALPVYSSTALNKERSAELQPGHQSILRAGSAIKIIKADTEEATAWKEGLFKFNNEKLETIMHKISRWYNVEVIYQHDNLKQTEYGGTVSRFEHISSVLDKLEYTGQVHFKIEGKKIIVTQ